MPILSASQLSLLFAEVEIFSGIDLEVNVGDRIGIVGPNGGGKTTLLRVLIGEYTANSGSIVIQSGSNIGYVPQNVDASTEGTLRDEVMKAFERVLEVEDELATSGHDIQSSNETERQIAEKRYSALLDEYEALGGYDYVNRMEQVVEGLGLPPATLDTPFSAASGGQRTRSALAKALLADPDILILDEPTNYLDFAGLAWLETFLSKFKRSFVVVSHDRYFLDEVANRIWELDHGKLKTFPGNYTKYRQIREEQLIRQTVEFERQKEVIAKEEFFIERYRYGTRSKEAIGREKRLNRMERLDDVVQDRNIKIRSMDATRTGLVTLRTRGVGVGYQNEDGPHKLFDMPDVALQRGSRTAVIGSNGIGKTTLIRTVLGEYEPISGQINLGHNVKPGLFSQGNLELPEDKNVLEAFMDISNMLVGESRSYLARFLFRSEDVYKPVTALSGGERARLALSRLMVKEPNVLILDEPTTHLDIPSREALEGVLDEYEGTLIFVSHDRRLISQMANQLWIIREGSLDVFLGTFEEWQKSEQHKTEMERSERVTTAKKQSRSAAVKEPEKPKIDYEALIAELESRLQSVERKLARASEKQDLDAISRFGEDYNSVQREIEDAWANWADD